MLCDQAMHLMAYTEGWQLNGNELFKQTAREIATYLFRDLQELAPFLKHQSAKDGKNQRLCLPELYV